MDTIASLLAGLVAKAPIVGVVLAILGTLLVVAQLVVVLTPTKKDDEVVAKAEGNAVVSALLTLLKSFALIQKKEDGSFVLSATKKK